MSLLSNHIRNGVWFEYGLHKRKGICVIKRDYDLLVIVHLYECQNGVFNAVKLDEGHSTIIGKELELGYFLASLSSKRGTQLVLVHICGNVRDVQCLRWRIDVVKVFRARSFESVQWRVGIVLRQSGILKA